MQSVNILTVYLDFVDIVNGMIELHWLALWCGVDGTTSTSLCMTQSLRYSLVCCLGHCLRLCNWPMATMAVPMVAIVVMDGCIIGCGWIRMVLLSTGDRRQRSCSRSWGWRCPPGRNWGYHMMRGTCRATQAWTWLKTCRTTEGKNQNMVKPRLDVNVLHLMQLNMHCVGFEGLTAAVVTSTILCHAAHYFFTQIFVPTSLILIKQQPDHTHNCLTKTNAWNFVILLSILCLIKL